MTWKPIRTVPEEFIGRSILVWVPKNRCVFAVVPYGERGTLLYWWGSKKQHQFEHHATQWRPMPDPPTRKKRR